MQPRDVQAGQLDTQEELGYVLPTLVYAPPSQVAHPAIDLEELVKQVAAGKISPDLIAQCSQQVEPEAASGQAINIDYDQASIAALKHKFEGVAASICEAMHARGLWPQAPATPVQQSHLPSGLPMEVPEEIAGLPFPQELGAHITEMWSRPNLKPSTKWGPGRLWQAYFDQFCALAVVPSAEELRQLQLDIKSFREKAVRLNLQTSADFLRAKLRSAVSTIRIQANMGALAQYQSQEATNCKEVLNSLLNCLPDGLQLDGVQQAYQVLQQNLAGLAVSAWASNALSFSMADVAAREVYATVQSLRKNALLTLFGKSCPQVILDRLVHLPIQAGSMFGPTFAKEIASLAKDQSCLSTLSAAVVQLGGSNLEGTNPQAPRRLGRQTVRFAGFKPPQQARNLKQPKQSWGAAWVKQTQSVPTKRARAKGRQPAQTFQQAAPQGAPPRAPRAPKQQLQQQQQLQAPQWAQPQPQQWPQYQAPPTQAQWVQPQEPPPTVYQDPQQASAQAYPLPQAQPFRGGRGGRRHKRGGGRGAGGAY